MSRSATTKIRRGLSLPIAGEPEPRVESAANPRSVGLIGLDYPGLKPKMHVAEGDTVAIGDPLFSDKKREGVYFTAPASGQVTQINRGERRILQSVVIEVDEQKDKQDAQKYEPLDQQGINSLSREALVERLSKTGLWTSLRTRPFGHVPALDTKPYAIFITAMASQPLSADADTALQDGDRLPEFWQGVAALSTLCEGKTYVCHKPGSVLENGHEVVSGKSVETHAFDGPHPAGLPGTHMHFLSPPSAIRTNWYANYEDVIAIGKLLLTGSLSFERVVALGGPQVESPCLYRTRLGANIFELTAGKLQGDQNRIISGSVFGGRTINSALSFLGRYDLQVSVLKEGLERPFLHYLRAGTNRFSSVPIYISKLFGGKKFGFTTSTNGSERAMVPTGMYERVMPLDVLPTQLLRALIVGDTDTAQQLGALELEEDDLALCTFVCSGKYEYGPILRENLAQIEKDG